MCSFYYQNALTSTYSLVFICCILLLFNEPVEFLKGLIVKPEWNLYLLLPFPFSHDTFHIRLRMLATTTTNVSYYSNNPP